MDELEMQALTTDTEDKASKKWGSKGVEMESVKTDGLALISIRDVKSKRVGNRGPNIR